MSAMAFIAIAYIIFSTLSEKKEKKSHVMIIEEQRKEIERLRRLLNVNGISSYDDET